MNGDELMWVDVRDAAVATATPFKRLNHSSLVRICTGSICPSIKSSPTISSKHHNPEDQDDING